MNTKGYLRWILIIASFAIISLILWNTYSFFQKFKSEERLKINAWSVAQSDFLKSTNNADLEIDITPLTSFVLTNMNTSTPMISVNEKDGSLNYVNINEEKAQDTIYLQKLITRFKKVNTPIPVTFEGELYSTIYYGNSELLNKLKYYPLALILIIILFGAVVFFFYKSSKVATQNKLWSGMAKETAHQIGTPLSSLIGWAELLKSENVKPDYILEIEKDIDRLLNYNRTF